MVDFTGLYTMSIGEFADILDTLTTCYIKFMKEGREVEEIYEKMGLNGRIAAYERAETVAKLLTMLGGKVPCK